MLIQVWFSATDYGWVVGHSYCVYAPLLSRNPSIIFEGKPGETRVYHDYLGTCVAVLNLDFNIIQFWATYNKIKLYHPHEHQESVAINC